MLKEDSGFAPALEARGVISLQMGNTFGALLDINNALKVSYSIISYPMHDRMAFNCKYVLIVDCEYSYIRN